MAEVKRSGVRYEQRVVAHAGGYRVTVIGLDEFGAAIAHAGAVDGFYDPTRHSGHVRFYSLHAAMNCAQRLG